MNIVKTLVITFAVTAATSALAQQPVKIGFVAELSGSQGALGQDMYDGFMLMVEQNGGKLGGVPVQVLREDSQLKPEVANQIVDRLIEKDRVPIITGITLSNIMMAIYKKVTDAEVFLIGSNASPSQTAGAQCSPFYFQTNGQNDQRAEAMGRYAAEKGYKRIYVMSPNFQAGKDYVAGFKREYKQPLLEEVYTPLNQLDFQAELAQVAAAKPDAVYVFYPGGLGVQFVRQWRQSGLAGLIPLLSGSTVVGINRPALQDAALGVGHASPWGPDLDNPANKKFVADFEKRFGRIPSEYAAASYDAAALIGSALAKVKGDVSNKQALRAALKEADFSSVKGSFKYNNNQLPIQNIYLSEVVKDDKGRYTHKTIQDIMPNAQDAYHAECAMK